MWGFSRLTLIVSSWWGVSCLCRRSAGVGTWRSRTPSLPSCWTAAAARPLLRTADRHITWPTAAPMKRAELETFVDFFPSRFFSSTLRVSIMWEWPSDRGLTTGCWFRPPFSGTSPSIWTPGTSTWIVAMESRSFPWKKFSPCTASRLTKSRHGPCAISAAGL